MKIFRKPDKETEAKNEQKAIENESITVFKEERKRKGSLQAKGKSGNAPEHGKA